MHQGKAMPRRARFCPAGFPVHLIQRGNNRQAIFTCDDDLAAYAHWLAEGAEQSGFRNRNIQGAGASTLKLKAIAP